MKAISLWEPWATLIALGKKRYETRSWETWHRGPLLICAGKRKLPLIQIASILYFAKLTPDDLQFNYGKALAIVDLDAIIRTNSLILNNWERVSNVEIETKLGDWSPGRYAWKLENIRRFVNPPHIRGRQGLFDVPDELIKDLETYDPV